MEQIAKLKQLLAGVQEEVVAFDGVPPTECPPKSQALLDALSEEFTFTELVSLYGAIGVTISHLEMSDRLITMLERLVPDERH